MRNFLVLTLISALCFSGCFFKSKKTQSEGLTQTAQTETEQTETIFPATTEDEEYEEENSATLKQSIIKYFTPSPSPSKKAAQEKAKEEKAAAKVEKTLKEAEKKEEKAEIKAAAKTEQNSAEQENKPAAPPAYPELRGQDDPEAIILKTEDGRLTSPFFLAPEASAEQTSKLKKPIWFGEVLTFNVGYSFIVAGEATLRTDRIVDKDGVLAYELRSDAKSHSVIDSVFKVRDINVSWLDVATFKSLGYWQSVKEGKYARDEWLIFDYEKQLFNNHKQDKHGNIKTQKFPFTGKFMLDMLSSLYYVRLQPLPEKGEVYFDIVNRQKQYPLKVVVRGKKKVKVKAGTFNCILVEPQFSGEGIFISKGKSLKVWLTDDERRLPVKMSVEVFIGSVTAELASYSLNEGK